jgi:hypothetical protein
MPKKDATPDIEDELESTEDTMPKNASAEPSLDGLVKMHRHGVTMHAHPSVIANHRQNGWQLVEG